MSMTLTLPKLGVNMTEAVIVAWRVKEGDLVREGDIVLEAETDKAIQEVPSTMTGVVGRILALEGETVACQAPIALLLEPGEAAAAQGHAAQPHAAQTHAARPHAAEERPPELQPAPSRPVPRTSPAAVPKPQPKGQQARTGRQRISPLARKTAATLGIDVGSLSPATPGARIVRADVLSAAADRGRGAAAMSAAKAEGASQLTIEASADRLLALQERFEKRFAQVGLLPLLVMVIARTIRIHPLALRPSREAGATGVDLAVMKMEREGLGVCALHDADSKGLLGIANEIAQGFQGPGSGDAAPRAGLGIIDMGAYGIDGYLPPASLLAESPVLALGGLRRGADTPASQVRMSLAFDAGVIDLLSASEFLGALKGFVEDPSLILSV